MTERKPELAAYDWVEEKLHIENKDHASAGCYVCLGISCELGDCLNAN